MANPAPNRRDTTMSRTIPMIRDRIVAKPSTPAARAMFLFSDMNSPVKKLELSSET